MKSRDYDLKICSYLLFWWVFLFVDAHSMNCISIQVNFINQFHRRLSGVNCDEENFSCTRWALNFFSVENSFQFCLGRLLDSFYLQVITNSVEPADNNISCHSKYIMYAILLANVKEYKSYICNIVFWSQWLYAVVFICSKTDWGNPYAWSCNISLVSLLS